MHNQAQNYTKWLILCPKLLFHLFVFRYFLGPSIEEKKKILVLVSHSKRNTLFNIKPAPNTLYNIYCQFFPSQLLISTTFCPHTQTHNLDPRNKRNLKRKIVKGIPMHTLSFKIPRKSQ